MLKLVVSRAHAYVWPWHIRFSDADGAAPYRDDCIFCGRAIAVPRRHQGAACACLYCGLERGHIPAVEHPMWASNEQPDECRVRDIN